MSLLPCLFHLLSTLLSELFLDLTRIVTLPAPASDPRSNFQKIIEFHKCFGLKHADSPVKDIFTADPKTVKLRLDLIREEFKELEEAAQNHDMKEVLDALADILYVTYGAGSSLGLDLDKAFGLVHESNMSKLCKDEAEAKETVAW